MSAKNKRVFAQIESFIMMAMNIANRPANHPPRTSYWKNSRKNYRVDVSLAPGNIREFDQSECIA